MCISWYFKSFLYTVKNDDSDEVQTVDSFGPTIVTKVVIFFFFGWNKSCNWVEMNNPPGKGWHRWALWCLMESGYEAGSYQPRSHVQLKLKKHSTYFFSVWRSIYKDKWMWFFYLQSHIGLIRGKKKNQKGFLDC